MRTASILCQTAIAVHNYHGTFNRLPNAASACEAGGLYPLGAERSFWFHLLPFIEQQEQYKKNIHNAAIITYLSPQDHSAWTNEGKISLAANIRLFGYQTLGPELADNAVDGTGAPSSPRSPVIFRST